MRPTAPWGRSAPDRRVRTSCGGGRPRAVSPRPPPPHPPPQQRPPAPGGLVPGSSFSRLHGPRPSRRLQAARSFWTHRSDRLTLMPPRGERGIGVPSPKNALGASIAFVEYEGGRRGLMDKRRVIFLRSMLRTCVILALALLVVIFGWTAVGYFIDPILMIFGIYSLPLVPIVAVCIEPPSRWGKPLYAALLGRSVGAFLGSCIPMLMYLAPYAYVAARDNYSILDTNLPSMIMFAITCLTVIYVAICAFLVVLYDRPNRHRSASGLPGDDADGSGGGVDELVQSWSWTPGGSAPTPNGRVKDRH